MLYPYAEFPNGLIITYTQPIEKDGKVTVHVNFEIPTDYGFNEGRYSLPDYEEIFNYGFTPSETKNNLRFLKSNAELIWKEAQEKDK